MTEVKSAFASGEAKLPLTTEAIDGETKWGCSSTNYTIEYQGDCEIRKASKDGKMDTDYIDPSGPRHSIAQGSQGNIINKLLSGEFFL